MAADCSLKRIKTGSCGKLTARLVWHQTAQVRLNKSHPPTCSKCLNAPNASNGYGMTGLMAMNTWQTTCYGEIRPGYIFLFPGIRTYNPPSYSGTVRLNCATHAALSFDSPGALHQQMCDILGRPATDFIGFSCMYPYNGPGKMGYHSWTCNPYWFNGSNEVPTNCNGVNWQQIIYNTMQTWLGS